MPDTAVATRRWSLQWPERAIHVLFWLSLVSMVALGASALRSPLQWADETMLGSGALSLARGGNGIATFSAFPEQSIPLHWFYGPTYFELSAWAMRIFGTSMQVYRAVCFAASLVFLVAVALYTWTLSHSRITVLLTVALVVFAPEFGSHATSGRMDTLGVSLVLGGTALYLMGFEEQRRSRSAGLLVVAAMVFGLGILTTPRCFPLAGGLAVASGLVALTRPAIRWALVRQMALFGGCVLALVAAWTYSQGFSPMGWLQIIRNTSLGDEWNSSPVLGGSWNFMLGIPSMFTLGALAIVLPGVVTTRLQLRPLSLSTSEAIAMGMMVVNLVLTFLVAARPFSYLGFWATPLLLTAVALLHPSWSTGAARTGSGASERDTTTPWSGFLIWACVIVTAGGAGLRLAKHLDTAAAWEARDPRPVDDFVRRHVPSGSQVFGPFGEFFWAVETNGSRYVSAHGWMGASREALPTGFDPTRVIGPPPSPIRVRDALLLWPDGVAFPRTFHCAEVMEIAHFQPPHFRTPRPWDRVLRRAAGYSRATLYRINTCSRAFR